ncbi:MAG: hypothetical protein O8C59_00540 [Candidatus Methanoperedens sp.]|nr:hypothetical protein [Candidatus Methanoperedens sp.]
MISDFIEFTKKTLEEKLGDSGGDILSRVAIKKPLNDTSSANDVSEFIKTVENIAEAISSKETAGEIGIILRDKEKPASFEAEIKEFLNEHKLPMEKDILDYTKLLTIKYGSNANTVEKEIIERVRGHVKSAISMSKLNEEINAFLTRYPAPENTDVDEFVHYIQLQKLNFKEDEIRDCIEKERLFRKFHVSGIAETSDSEAGVSQFINLIRTAKDKEDVNKVMRSQGLSYLIKDEPGCAGKGLSDFMDTILPAEGGMRDTIKGAGQ